MCELTYPALMDSSRSLTAFSHIHTVGTNVLGVFYTAQAAAKHWVDTKYTKGKPKFVYVFTQ